jgi:hypothetical protein
VLIANKPNQFLCREEIYSMKKVVNIISILSLLAFLVMLAPINVLAQAEVTCESDVVVQGDDWLSKLADKFYGDPQAFPAIADATNAKAATDDSYATIANVDMIEIGWKLCIPSAASQALKPGDKIGNMALSIGPLPFDLMAIPPWPAFCDSNPALKLGATEGKPGVYTVECTVPPLAQWHIGGGWIAGDDQLRDADWSAQHKELYVNGQLIDQTAFGSVDADVPVQALPGQDASEVSMVKLRVWNVVLENLAPGSLTLRQVMRFDKPLLQGQATMPAGDYDFNYNITVDASAAVSSGTPEPVQITR